MINLKNIEKNLKPLKQGVLKTKTYRFLNLSNSEITLAANNLRQRIAKTKDENAVIPDVFALVAEAVRRTLGFQVHDNQLMAAQAMAAGNIVELATGEGKTLSAVFTAALKVLSGKKVHILTFNDYLARRDATWMGGIYELLGISVAFVIEKMTMNERKFAYSQDITYGTAKEVGFDYLRDFLAFKPENVVLKGFDFAMIDEADSILIDEARIPLVISGDEPSNIEMEKRLFDVATCMESGVHFDIEDNSNNIYLNDVGISFVQDHIGIKNLYDEMNLDILAKITVILQAEHILKRDVDYIVSDDEVLLIDSFTGRVAVNRQWPEGLHAAVEIKEGIRPKTQGIIMNRITLRDFCGLYSDFCGMTGTAASSANEFMEFYDRGVTVIPSEKPCIRIDHDDNIYTTKTAKFNAVVEAVLSAHICGRPVLVGTASIEESEFLSNLLTDKIPSLRVLNAKNDTEEAEIIAKAGRIGAVTISTNMAGRGVDICLGGKNASEDEYERVCSLGGLYIIGTTHFDSIRIDNQLRGRAGRQGDPGESRFFISIEDDLFEKHGLKERIPEKNLVPSDSGLLDSKALRQTIAWIQEIVEGRTFDAKITLRKYSQLIEDERKLVHKRRMDILYDKTSLSLPEKFLPERYTSLVEQVGIDEYKNAQRQIELYVIGKLWAKHLAFSESISDEIFVRGKVRGDPLANYTQQLNYGFERLQENIRKEILDVFSMVTVTDGKIDLERMGICGPTSTKTFLVHDGTESEKQLGLIGNLTIAPRIIASFLIEKFKRRKEQAQ